MKNIYIRGRINEKISNDIKHKKEKVRIDYVKFEGINKEILARDEFYDLKFIFDFNLESAQFLSEIKSSIQNLDSNKLVYLCDSYKFRFFKTFDYVIENIDINKNNLKNIYLLFKDLFENGETVNSLNLSILILNLFSKNKVLIFLNEIKEDLNYLEVSSFLMKDKDVRDECTYFSLFKSLYGNEDKLSLVKYLNKNCFSSLKFILSFYLFRIRDFKIKSLKCDDIESFLEYILNVKNSINKLSGDFLFLDKFQLFKLIIEDINLILDKTKSVLNFKEFNEDICFLNLNLFTRSKNEYLNDEFLNFLYERLLSGIYDGETGRIRKIISIYNILDVNISKEISEVFKLEYESVDFFKIVLISFRDYKYFVNILNEIEDSVYITKFICDHGFRNLILRILSVVYTKNDSDMICIKFIKCIVSYKKFYFEGSNYINFIVQKILERS